MAQSTFTSGYQQQMQMSILLLAVVVVIVCAVERNPIGTVWSCRNPKGVVGGVD